MVFCSRLGGKVFDLSCSSQKAMSKWEMTGLPVTHLLDMEPSDQGCPAGA